MIIRYNIQPLQEETLLQKPILVERTKTEEETERAQLEMMSDFSFLEQEIGRFDTFPVEEEVVRALGAFLIPRNNYQELTNRLQSLQEMFQNENQEQNAMHLLAELAIKVDSAFRFPFSVKRQIQNLKQDESLASIVYEEDFI